MPVLESTDHTIAPKSVLRHRPIGDSTSPKGKRSATTTAPTTSPVAQRASRPHPSDVDDDVTEWKCATEQKNTQQVKAQSATKRTTTAPVALPRTPSPKAIPTKREMRLQGHPLLYLGLGMIVALSLWMLLTMVFGWFTTTLDDLHYGRPRTFQTDAWVGHNEQTGTPSHFIAINLNRHIEIIEIDGGDPAHTRMYTGPQLYGNGDELVPVTLKFIDVNGDHKPDMLIQFQGSRLVLINDSEGFRPLLPQERQQVEQVLQHLGQ